MISKKQAKAIISAVNGIVCYSGMVTAAIAAGNGAAAFDPMRWHDDAIEDLNKMLGVKHSIAMYNKRGA